MFKTIKSALKSKDVRKRLLYTLLLIVVFRLGCAITAPGVDALALQQMQDSMTGNSLTGLIDIISGGAFSNLSIFAMSITPYITASIIIQLLSMIITPLEKLVKEGGERGKELMNKYTKLLALVLSIIEGIGVYISYSSSSPDIFVGTGFRTAFIMILSLVAGTAILMWLGEQITNKGIGNGVSMLIFIGIASSIPQAARAVWNRAFPSVGSFQTTDFLIGLGIVLGTILLVTAVVFVQAAERRIPVQYAKKVVGRKMYGGQNTHIPLKMAMAGVMPIIFASSFMTFPAMIIQMFNANIETATGFLAGLYKYSVAISSSTVATHYAVVSAIVYLILIVGFTYFYTYATFNPAEVSNNIKKNGGFIPGIRTGKPTTDYLTSVLSKIMLFGGTFLAAIAILPMLVRFTGLNIAFGGTSILIIVGVAIETVQQLESHLVMKQYKGFLE